MIRVNGKPIYPQSLIDFVKTETGLKKVEEYLEDQKAKYNPAKEANKCEC
jgi:hypothetical protein